MGGAARRPANSGIGAIDPNRSNIFYQKLLNRTSSGGGKEKGLKGKRNCCRLRFLLVPLRGTRIASHSLRPRFARPSLAGKIFASFIYLLHLFFSVVFDINNMVQKSRFSKSKYDMPKENAIKIRGANERERERE